ncbi:hypothetical protein PENNAL_c0117G12081 [Penicillium nalgiovense]|uniref:Uncharacterized protein n=1 Tax=Penicillium nalgiovense TaxID=60175 RepID=A0A1V6X5H9_PENNA|nr:hypothetical protein PENNAL_c0117G12081 [Penicillium nalgiovense]
MFGNGYEEYGPKKPVTVMTEALSLICSV